MKHTEDTLRNVDARSEGDTAGTMTVGEQDAAAPQIWLLGGDGPGTIVHGP